MAGLFGGDRPGGTWATGSDEERLTVFRRVRDEIHREIFNLLATV